MDLLAVFYSQGSLDTEEQEQEEKEGVKNVKNLDDEMDDFSILKNSSSLGHAQTTFFFLFFLGELV